MWQKIFLKKCLQRQIFHKLPYTLHKCTISPHHVNPTQYRNYAKNNDPNKVIVPFYTQKPKRESVMLLKKQKFKEAKLSQFVEPKINRLEITKPMKAAELAQVLGVKQHQVMRLLPEGFEVSKSVCKESIARICKSLGVKPILKEIEIKEFVRRNKKPRKDWPERPPVITIMGHVNHGKTTLLDRLRNTNVVAEEAGGITQHIGAFQVEYEGQQITVIDTPGHEAFSQMRAAGTHVTDLVVLIIAVNDGIMPQTIESIELAQKEGVPIIVALNKIDTGPVNMNSIQRELLNYNVVCENFGGNTPIVPISALNGTNIDKLMEEILLQATDLDLRAPVDDHPAEGVVLESRVDKGLGNLASVLIKKGTLKPGAYVVSGTVYGKVRFLRDNRLRELSEVKPGQPAEVVGLPELPKAGDGFFEVTDEGSAKSVIFQKLEKLRLDQEDEAAKEYEERMRRYEKLKKEELENLANSEDKFLMKTERPDILKRQQEALEEKLKKKLDEMSGNILPLIIKVDVVGTLDAVNNLISKFPQDEVKVKIIRGGVGQLSEADIELARTENAYVVGMGVKPSSTVASLAKKYGVKCESFRVIYNFIDRLKEEYAKLLPKIRIEEVEGEAVVNEVFKVTPKDSKKEVPIAGCTVKTGAITRKADFFTVYRWNQPLYPNLKLLDLRHFQDQVREVKKGYECGIYLEGYTDIKPGDIIRGIVVIEKSQNFDEYIKTRQGKQSKKEQTEELYQRKRRK